MLAIDLTGKVALVVGGSRGIGAGITRALCRAGAVTVFTHTGNPTHQAGVAQLVNDLRAKGGQVEAEALDAHDAAGTTDLAKKIVDRHGHLSALVFNVGQNPVRPVEQIDDAGWRRGVELNLTTAFYAVRAVLPHMLRASYGRIVLVGSSAVYNGGGGAIDYAAAKAGLAGMMAYLAREYARRGILTNTVHPAVIDTDLLRARYTTEEARAQITTQIPAGRLGQPEDIGGMVAYLASSWGDYICGQSILLDGGRTLFR